MMSGFSQMMLTCILLLVNYMQIGSSEQSSKSVTMLDHEGMKLNSSLTKELIENATVKIYCESNVNMSASEISWKFNGDPLQQTAEVADSKSVLTIDILSFNQSGIYSCGFEGGNELWENVSITVGLKPQPVRNLTCVEKPGYHFNCSWLPSKIETNLPTTYYYRKINSRDVISDEVMPGHDDWKKVENSYIDFEDEPIKHHFSVKSQNALGDSEVVTTTFSIEVTPADVFGTFFNNGTELYVNWTIPSNHLINSYKIRYREIFPTLKKWDQKYDMFAEHYKIPVGDGYSEYEIKVAVDHYEVDDIIWSETVIVKKQETRPTGNVSGNCTWNQVNDNRMDCFWDALSLDKHNGRLLGYNVSVFREDEMKRKMIEANNSIKVLHATFEELPMIYDYTVNVTAYNSAGSTTILSIAVDSKQPASRPIALALGYIVSIVCLSILLLFLIILLLVRYVKKADFMKPLPELKYFYSSECETLGCAEKHHSEVETFNELNSRNTANEKGDQSKRTFMLPKKGFELNEDLCLTNDQQTKPVMEVTNLTYLISGRKKEQQNNNVSHPDLNEDDLQKMNSSEENSDDTSVCYLHLRNGNLLTQVQHHGNASEVISDDPNSPSINPLPMTASPVPNSGEAYESLLTNRSSGTLSSEGYVSGSGTSCLTAYTQLSTT